MPVDYAEKEREFLSELKADTGRDLSQWMAAISAESFKDKNEVIDWLRAQGFMFWKASWLERVHHNGGRPIYADAATARANAEFALNLLEPSEMRSEQLAATPAAATATATVPPWPVEPAAVSKATEQPLTRAPDVQAPPTAIAELLARAKGYRPLAEFLLRTLRAAAPGADITVQGGLALVSDGGQMFALIAPGPREIKLGLALGNQPSMPLVPRGRVAGAPDEITHVIALTDARQITPELQGLIRAANMAKRG